MKVVKPINITDSIFTVSSVAEPDPLRGEVEWVDKFETPEFGSYVGMYNTASLANDGNIYCVGGVRSQSSENRHVATQTVKRVWQLCTG